MCFSLFPLLLPLVDSWDFAVVELGFFRHDDSYFEVFRQCFHVRFLILVLLEKLYQLGISPKMVMNVVAVLCIMGMARNVFFFLRERYGFSWEASLLGAWGILAFPVWHTQISGSVFSYVLFFYLFTAAVIQWWRSHYARAAILLVISLNYYSLFAFAVGLAVSEFVLTVERNNFRRKAVQTFLFSAILLTGYILLDTFVNIHELSGTYNTLNASMAGSFVGYALGAALVFAVARFTLGKLPEEEFKRRFMRNVLSLLVLGFFAVMAYWAVGLPMRYFSFGSYGSRHTYLTCIPFALLLALVWEVLVRLWTPKAATLVAGGLVLILVILQHQGYSHKVAALAYREIIAQEIAKQGEPDSGYVVIQLVDGQAPRHVHAYELARSLYTAFGKTAWMLNDPWRRSHIPTPENMRELYAATKGTKGTLSDQVSGDAYTRFNLYLDGYHQEGRVWYWWYYLTGNYEAFQPRLVLVEKIPSVG
ncbi:MAG: hypothetical protein V3571_07180 [Pseudodesulfovibrio sp.]